MTGARRSRARPRRGRRSGIAGSIRGCEGWRRHWRRPFSGRRGQVRCASLKPSSEASAPDRARPAPQGGRDAPTHGLGAILCAEQRALIKSFPDTKRLMEILWLRSDVFQGEFDWFEIEEPRTGQAGAPVARPPGTSPGAHGGGRGGGRRGRSLQSGRVCPAGAVSRLPAQGRRGPICRRPNRSGVRRGRIVIGGVGPDRREAARAPPASGERRFPGSPLCRGSALSATKTLRRSASRVRLTHPS